MKLHLPKRLFTALLTAITLAAAPAALTLGSAAWGEEEVSTPVEAQADYSVYDVTKYDYDIVRWQGSANTKVSYSVCYAPYELASYTNGAFVFTSEGVVSSNPYQTYVTGSDFYTFMFNEDSACDNAGVALYDINNVQWSGIIVTKYSNVGELKANSTSGRNITLGKAGGAAGYTSIAKDFELNLNSNTLTVAGTQTWDVVGADTTFKISNTSNSSQISNGAELTIKGQGAVQFTSVFTNNGSVIVQSGSTLSISSAITNSGTITINEGARLQINSLDGFSGVATGDVTLSNTTHGYQIGYTEYGLVTGSGTLTINGSVWLNDTDITSSVQNGKYTVAGQNSVYEITSSYTGNVIEYNGTSGDTASANSFIIGEGAALKMTGTTGSNNILNKDISGAGTLIIATDLAFTGTSAAGTSHIAGFTGTVDIESGSLHVGNYNNGTNGGAELTLNAQRIIVRNGATLWVHLGGGTTSKSISPAIDLLSGATLSNRDGNNILNGDIRFNIVDPSAETPTYNSAGKVTLTQLWDKEVEFRGLLSGDGIVELQAPSEAWAGSASSWKLLNGANTFKGSYNLTDSSNNKSKVTKLILAAENAAQYATINLNGSGSVTSLELNQNATIKGLNSTDADNYVTTTTAATLTVSEGSFAGKLQDGTNAVLSLTKTGTGTLTLSGTNTYTGSTSVQGGELILTSASALGSGKISISENAKFTLKDANYTITQLVSGAGELVVKSGVTMTLSNGDNDSGRRFDANLRIEDGGIVNIFGTNTSDQFNYGSTRTVYLEGSGSELNFGATRQTVGNWTFDMTGGTISGNGASGNPYALDFHNTGHIKAHAAEGASAANPTVSTVSASIKNRDNGQLNLVVDENARLDLTGNLKLEKPVEKSGAGLAVIKGTVTQLSGVTVSAGTLELQSSVETGSAFTVKSGAGFEISAGKSTLGGAVTNGGAITVSGGSATINGAVTNNGAITVSGGTADFSNTLGMGTGSSLSVSGGSATVSGALNVTGTGVQITQSGEGQLSLLGQMSVAENAAATLSGAITLGHTITNDGTLTLDGTIYLTGDIDSTYTHRAQGGSTYALADGTDSTVAQNGFMTVAGASYWLTQSTEGVTGATASLGANFAIKDGKQVVYHGDSFYEVFGESEQLYFSTGNMTGTQYYITTDNVVVNSDVQAAAAGYTLRGGTMNITEGSVATSKITYTSGFVALSDAATLIIDEADATQTATHWLRNTTGGAGTTIEIAANANFGEASDTPTESEYKTNFSGKWVVSNSATLKLGGLDRGWNWAYKVDLLSLESLDLDGGNLRFFGDSGKLGQVNVKQDAHFYIYEMFDDYSLLNIKGLNLYQGATLTMETEWRSHVNIAALSGAGTLQLEGGDTASSFVATVTKDFTGSLSFAGSNNAVTVSTGTESDISFTSLSATDVRSFEFNVLADTSIGSLTAAAGTVNISENKTLTLGGGTDEAQKTHGIGTLAAASAGVTLGDYATLTLGGGTAEAPKAHSIGTLSGGTGSKLDLAAHSALALGAGDIGVIFTGSGELTKTGGGTLTLTGNNGSFTGNIIVSSGILKAGTSQSAEYFGDDYKGNKTRKITVQDGATLDVNGTEAYYHVVLEQGATITNSGTNTNNNGNVGSGWKALPWVELEGDAEFNAQKQMVMQKGDGDSGTFELDLNGHTLTKIGGANLYLKNVKITSGTIQINSGGVELASGVTLEEGVKIGMSAGQLTLNVDASLEHLSATGGSVSVASGKTLTLGGGTAEAPVTHSIGTLTGGDGSKLHLAENAVLSNVSSVSGVTLTGSGTYNYDRYTADNAFAPGFTLDADNWTGTVALTTGGSGIPLTYLKNASTAKSKLQLTGFKGYLDNADHTMSNNLILVNGADGYGLLLDNGSFDKSPTVHFTGSIEGSGNLVYAWKTTNGSAEATHVISSITSAWEGKFVRDLTHGSGDNTKAGKDVVVKFTAGGDVFADTDTSGVEDAENTGKLSVVIEEAPVEGVLQGTNFRGSITNVGGVEVKSNTVFYRNVTTGTATVDAGKTAKFDSTLTANTVQLGNTATITGKQGSAATMSNVQMSSTGIGTAQDGSSSISNADIEIAQLAQEATFTIADMTLTNTSITAASVNFSNSKVSGNVVLNVVKPTEAEAITAPNVGTGGSGEISFTYGLALVDSSSTLTLNMEVPQAILPSESGLYNLTITLNGFADGFDFNNIANQVVFGADSWLGKALQGAIPVVTVNGSTLGEGTAAAQSASGAPSVSYAATSGSGSNVGSLVITINGLNVPEPTTSTLSLIALAALVARRRRK